MSFIAAAIIGGGALVASTALSKGGGGVGFAGVPQTKSAKIARRELLELATGDLPDVPLRKIAPLEPLGEERLLARKTAKELAEPQDFLSLPEVQAIIFEATQKGDLLANRLGRALQATGNITSTPGRDVLGRAVTDVQKNITASLAPFAVEERRRRERLIPTLEGLGLTEEERRRGVTQAEKDAFFQKQTGELGLETEFRPRLLESVIGLQPAVQPFLPSRGADPLAGVSQLIGPLLGAFLTGGGGGINPAAVLPGTSAQVR